MQYRREIDGLRAVAVIPVILFHAGFTIFSGGYVGVDIFFVISGYLITSIIISELEQGKFSILRFYERRARRILPALFFVLLFCIPFAWMWMLPAQVRDFSQSLVAVSVFASNILFWRESGYFAADSEEKPLLHTWSLAVEEQYYMLFPIFLILVWRFGRSPVFYSIIAISIISLLLSEWGWRNNPEANFYLAPTRVWELLAGSISAFLQFGKTQKSNNAFSVLGLALIVFAIFFYDESTPFPSAYALAPVLGTALIIMYGARETWVARLLSLKGFVGIGLISYSAYLWHQPLFAFARIRSLYAPEQWVMLVLAIASLGLAYFSWRYVEHPFRRRTEPALRSQRAVFGVACVVGAAFIAFGLYGHFNNGLEREATGGECNFDKSNCYSKDNTSLKIALWGDSYADAFSLSLANEISTIDASLYLFIRNGCPSILFTVRNGDKSGGKNDAVDCIKFNEKSIAYIKEIEPNFVIITSAYDWYLNEQNYDGEPILLDVNDNNLPAVQFLPNRLAETIAEIQKTGARVILVTPHPTVEEFSEKRKAVKFGTVNQIFADFLSAETSRNLIIDVINQNNQSIAEVNGLNLFCENKICPIIGPSGSLSLYDGSHISTSLAATVTTQIVEILSSVNKVID